MYRTELDAADTLFATNYLLGYFRTASDAPHLMRLQKEAELKQKRLWHEYQSPFASAAQIQGPDFGVNLYAVGAVSENKTKLPPYLELLTLTSSHINAGGWSCCDFVLTLSNQHQTVRFLEGEPPLTEFVLGFIRLDAGVLNNAPLQRFLGINRLEPDFVNQHLLTAKVLVPTQPFGSLLRGGKLLALLATSNELRDFWNQRFNRNIAVFYTTSLYGSSKSSSQYEQLNRYLRFIGETDASFPLRIKEPHKRRIIDWMHERGVSRSNFTFTGSSKADRSHKAIVDYVRWCLWRKKGDKNIGQILSVYDDEMKSWKNGKTECKRTYISTYGHEEWDEVLIGRDVQSNPEYDLSSLFQYWKRKVFKEKSWGLRKYMRDKELSFNLYYQYLNSQLQESNFVQVR